MTRSISKRLRKRQRKQPISVDSIVALELRKNCLEVLAPVPG